MLGGGPTERCSTASSWSDEKIAVAAGAYYLGTALDDTRFCVYAMPAPDVSLETLDAAIDRVVAQMASEKAIDEDDLARAKTRLIADAVYAQDSQSSLARWYGAALATGDTVEAVAELARAHRRGDRRGRARGRRQMARQAPRRDRLPAAAGRRRQGGVSAANDHHTGRRAPSRLAAPGAASGQIMTIVVEKAPPRAPPQCSR